MTWHIGKRVNTLEVTCISIYMYVITFYEIHEIIYWFRKLLNLYKLLYKKNAFKNLKPYYPPIKL